MDDRQQARQKRGQTSAGKYASIAGLSDSELIRGLEDVDPQTRTAAARLLGERKCCEAIPHLCTHLAMETALYTRIALSEALAAIGEPALPGLIDLLGKIGRNQHESLPKRGFYKKSYPLPRDLAARTIIRIGPTALPFLEKVVAAGDRTRLLEALDSIGHIAFCSKDDRSEPVLLVAYDTYRTDPVVFWKIVRAFQSFPSERVRQRLGEIICCDERPEIRWEAVRSLGQLGLVVPADVILHAQMDVHEEVQNMARMFLT